jgi:membrane-associated phospholipid phosphatase
VATSHSLPWAAELRRRTRKTLVVTVAGTSLFTGVFFIGYFFVQWHPAFVPIVMPLTALDRIIPFQPGALLAYVSLWIYIGAGPGLQRTFADIAVYALWMGALCITGLLIFYFWPTQVPALALDAAGIPGFAVLHRLDEASNACPSMHVAVALFTAVRVDDAFRSTRSPVSLRILNATWFSVIAYSTLAVKQHVVLDVAAGALLGLAFVLPSMRWRPSQPLAADSPSLMLE